MRYSANHMRVAFQGELGSNGHAAVQEMFPGCEYETHRTFEGVFESVQEGRADRGVLYVENAIYGRIADVHRLLPDSGLKIVSEYFLPVHHQLLGLKDAELSDVTKVISMAPALGQCRNTIKELGLETEEVYDTAGAAKQVAETNDKTLAAIAPRAAAELYGLKILKENIEDVHDNATRCIAVAKDMMVPEPGVPTLTTFIFQVKNIPAALYKALGCFATNGLNLTKLESYQLNGSFISTQFYVDVEGSINDETLKHAFSELENYADNIVILGSYPRDMSRRMSE